MNDKIKQPKIVFICETCKSKNIVGTANAIWNARTQQWDAADILDSQFCEDCEAECDFESRDMTPEEENEHKVETNDIAVLLLLLQKARDELTQMSRYGLEDRALLNDIDAALGKTVEDDQQAKGDDAIDRAFRS